MGLNSLAGRCITSVRRSFQHVRRVFVPLLYAYLTVILQALRGDLYQVDNHSDRCSVSLKSNY